MNTTHVIVFPVSDPEALRLYSNESFLNECKHPSGFFMLEGKGGRDRASTDRAVQWYWEGAMEFTIDGVAFVRRTVR
jgi:hypothetical protein